MTKRQLICCLSALVVVLLISGIVGYVCIERYKYASKINAQTEIERTRIEQEAKLERTRERMNWIPWYKGGSNKDETPPPPPNPNPKESPKSSVGQEGTGN